MTQLQNCGIIRNKTETPYAASRGARAQGCPLIGAHRLVNPDCHVVAAAAVARRRSASVRDSIPRVWRNAAVPGTCRWCGLNRQHAQSALDAGQWLRGWRLFSFFLFSFFLFFRRDALKEQFGKEPSTVRCLAVKSALLGTRHPRKEKEAALQNVTGEPACQYGKILMTTQSEYIFS